MIEDGISPAGGTPHTLLEVRATTGQYLRAGAEDVLLQNSPLAAFNRERARINARFARPLEVGDELQALDLQERERAFATGDRTVRPDRQEVPMLAGEEATRRYKDLELKWEGPVAAGEAELIAETKRRELAAAATFQAARAATFDDAGGLGVGRAALSVATDFFGSAIDPVNLASAFLPIVGQTSRLALMTRFGRFGGPAIAGVVEGAAGAALLEPVLASSALAEQRDYHFSDSVANVLLGGVLGGGLGALHGFFGRGQLDAGVSPGRSDPALEGGAGLVPSGPAPFSPRDMGAYAKGWQAALETDLGKGPRTLEEWAPAIWSREAPMVQALEQVAPETRRQAGQVALLQYLNGRAIDVDPVLSLDPDWKPPASDALVKLKLLIDQRRIAGYLEAPKIEPATAVAQTADARAARSEQPASGSRYQDFAPGELIVDAKRFQFKAGGDQKGVTDRLAGVTKWDQRLAGVGIVWQAKDGKLYVVDGHQRHGLATRLAAEGQKPQLHSIVLREVDGESEGFARALAAFKNVAEGSGTAIDAAKILRETARDEKLRVDLEAGRLPPLPPSSVLVRDASALAKLPDHAFGIVAAGKVEPNQAAHVTRILSDPKQQTAAIEMLAKLAPDTSEQARLIVEQIRAAGFKEGETVDLFGREDVAASLMLERAKVLEATARALKKDASVFRTLVDRENVAVEAGNVLARDANLERLSDDRAALAVLEALANRAGTIAAALNQAAQDLGSGRTLRSVVNDFLKTVRAEAGQLRRPGAAAEGRLGQDLEGFAKASAATDTIGDPSALERQRAELEAAPKENDLLALTEAEKETLSIEAKQALEASPELKQQIDAANAAAEEADLFGRAAEGLAACKVTGGE